MKTQGCENYAKQSTEKPTIVGLIKRVLNFLRVGNVASSSVHPEVFPTEDYRDYISKAYYEITEPASYIRAPRRLND